jgi:hypothetical protein
VVVLEDHDVGRLVEHPPQRRRPRLVERSSGRVLPARVDDDRARAFAEGLGEPRGNHPSAVDWHRPQCQPKRPEQVEETREAGIFDSDDIAGAKLCLKGALDPVEGAADDCHVTGVDPVGLQFRPCQVEQLRGVRLFAIKPSR